LVEINLHALVEILGERSFALCKSLSKPINLQITRLQERYLTYQLHLSRWNTSFGSHLSFQSDRSVGCECGGKHFWNIIHKLVECWADLWLPVRSGKHLLNDARRQSKLRVDYSLLRFAPTDGYIIVSGNLIVSGR
jgi:hypothetical protein